VSPQPRRSTGTGEWAALDGHMSAAESEGWSSVAYNHSPRHARAPLGTHELVHRRRAAVAHARRRRLRLLDLALGLALALLAIALAPGLAIVALIALVGLLACAASLAVGRVRRRRRTRRADPSLRGTVTH
jgi:hypothetical protein